MDNNLAGDTSFLNGSGEMAELIRSMDWSSTPLGPVDSWPQSLRTTVSLCLASSFPINIIWGPANTQIYNDGYRAVYGSRHPAALGMDYTECWDSAWPGVGEAFERARMGGTSFLENERMFLFRNGYLEETFFTFSMSPILDASGAIGGVFHPVTETTASTLAARRTRALRDLTAHLAEAKSNDDVCRLAIETLAGYSLDLPFTLLYKLDATDNTYRLFGSAGLDEGTALSDPTIAPDGAGVWPLADLDRERPTARVDGLRERLGPAQCGPYEEAPDVAFVIPAWREGCESPSALLVAGVSARLPLTDTYCGFYELLGAAFGAALTRVVAAEEARTRLDMLTAMDRAKTEFFSNVSHEFRTPLTLLLGPLEDAAQDPAIPEVQRDRLEMAHRNALRLLKMVNSLLDYSRIEAGRAVARFVPVDLAALTSDLASGFRSACTNAGISLEVNAPPLEQAVYVDTEMWEKIILNLLSNAFKFTLAGGISLTLRQHADAVELIVADTGVGIPAAQIGSVFERFHRVQGQNGRSVEGTGIGLSLVRELVQLHGGAIEVDSVEGSGTIFRLSIPLGLAHLPPDQVHEKSAWPARAWRGGEYAEEAMLSLRADAGPAAASTARPAMPGAPRIVLADDNADMRAYIERILVDAGYQVDAVADGAAALAAIRSGPAPDLVLTDLMMPGMDGFKLLGELRADSATTGMVVMLISARAGEEARLEGLAAGADDYIVKPFSARELRARVDGAIALAGHRRKADERVSALLVEIEKERGRAALRETEAHVASFFEQTAAGVAEADLQGCLIRVNDRYCDIVGRPREALLGRPGDGFDLARAGKDAFEIDRRYERPDGTAVWVSMTITPIRDAATGVAEGALAVVLDITGRKLAEDEVIEASHRKDEFLAMLAHELRNPLAPISAAAELMAVVKLDEARLKRTSAIITRQVRHMTSLVDDLLDVSRVTRGLVAIDRSAQDIGRVVANAVEQVSPLIEARRHQLITDLAPQGGVVLGEQKRLVQVLSNLLNNAAKYTPDGGVITLRTRVDGASIVISVEDTGIGISPELQPRVFDLFAQAERTPDRSQGGLGLGLALVKSMVELHGGTVVCSSAGIGMGSCFAVRLPLLEEPDKPAPAPVEARAPATGTLRIMVVDDNVDAAMMLSLLLEASGYEVMVEYDSGRALALAAAERPDIGILDIGLPDIDGNEVARRLRAGADTSHMVLIAVTGYGQESDRAKAMVAGFDHYLVKPVDTARLMDILNKLRRP